jgi:hypothetical protein
MTAMQAACGLVMLLPIAHGTGDRVEVAATATGSQSPRSSYAHPIRHTAAIATF